MVGHGLWIIEVANLIVSLLVISTNR